MAFQPKTRHRLRFLLSAALLAALGAFIGYRLHGSVPPWITTESDPVSAQASHIDIIHAPDFQFILGESARQSGRYDAVSVAADGSCVYIFRPSRESLDRKKAQFRLDPATIADLRKLLADADFFRRKLSYVDKNVADGLQRWITVSANGIEKSVSCDNYFPEFEERIRNFVTDRIINTHTADIAAATLTSRNAMPILRHPDQQ